MKNILRFLGPRIDGGVVELAGFVILKGLPAVIAAICISICISISILLLVLYIGLPYVSRSAQTIGPQPSAVGADVCAPQMLKRHHDLTFEDDPESRPIIITALAAHPSGGTSSPRRWPVQKIEASGLAKKGYLSPLPQNPCFPRAAWRGLIG